MSAWLCWKSFRLGFSSTWTKNFQMYKLGFKEAEEPEIKLPASFQSQKKQENSRKTSSSALLTTLKHLTLDHNRLWKSLKEIRVPDSLTYTLRNLYVGQEATVRTWHGTQTGSKLGKEYDKAVYCHLAYLTYMQCTSWVMPGWINHKKEPRLLGEISTFSDMQMAES